MKYTLASIIILIISGCGETIPNNPQLYKEVQLQNWLDGFYTERLEPNYTDNKIYNNCLEVIDEYFYIKNDEIRYFKQEEFMGHWDFITREELDNGIGVKRIRLTALNPDNNFNNPPQSAIQYELLNSKNENLDISHTAVVENYKNIVIHNTRAGFFRSLFSFPWPSVKLPIDENQKWNWKFSYNSGLYGDDRLFNWKDITEMKYTYSYLGEETLNLKLGSIKTSKFEAFGTDGTINNKLIYYFNSKLGFVKQQFFTQDGAKIEFEAVEYKNNCE